MGMCNEKLEKSNDFNLTKEAFLTVSVGICWRIKIVSMTWEKIAFFISKSLKFKTKTDEHLALWVKEGKKIVAPCANSCSQFSGCC